MTLHIINCPMQIPCLKTSSYKFIVVFKPVTVSFPFTNNVFKTRKNSLSTKVKRSSSANIFMVFRTSGLCCGGPLSLDEISFTPNSLQPLQVSSAAWRCALTSPGKLTGSTHTEAGGLLVQGGPPSSQQVEPIWEIWSLSLFGFLAHNFTVLTHSHFIKPTDKIWYYQLISEKKLALSWPPAILKY